jgi:hypothetical protein
MRLLALIVATAGVATAAGPAQIVVTGQYSSNYDAVTLIQLADRVTGTYKCCGGGTIEGQIDGSTLRFRWKQPGSWGSGVWQISPGRLEGTWGANQSETSGGRWDLVLVRPAQRIAN